MNNKSDLTFASTARFTKAGLPRVPVPPSYNGAVNVVLGHHPDCAPLVTSFTQLLPSSAAPDISAFAARQQALREAEAREDDLLIETSKQKREIAALTRRLMKRQAMLAETNAQLQALDGEVAEIRDEVWDMTARLKQKAGLNPEFELVEDGAWDVCRCNCHCCEEKKLEGVEEEKGIGGVGVGREEALELAKRIVALPVPKYDGRPMPAKRLKD